MQQINFFINKLDNFLKMTIGSGKYIPIIINYK